MTPGSGIFVNMSYFVMTSVFLTAASFYCPNFPLRVLTVCGNKKKYEVQMLSMMRPQNVIQERNKENKKGM